VSREIDEASGLLWRDGCVGPKVTKGFVNLNEVESNFPSWNKADRLWATRAAKGPGTRGGPEGTRTSYFYDGAFTPFGKTWGAPFAPTGHCPLAPVGTTTTQLRSATAARDVHPADRATQARQEQAAEALTLARMCEARRARA
jgi:hypothetical protein